MIKSKLLSYPPSFYIIPVGFATAFGGRWFMWL